MTLDTLKGAALIAIFIGFLSIFATWGIAVGECVASVSRAHTRCNLRCSTQSPWPVALPSLIVDVVADGGVSVDIVAPVGVVVV